MEYFCANDYISEHDSSQVLFVAIVIISALSSAAASVVTLQTAVV
jgi:hypothetical protein